MRSASVVGAAVTAAGAGVGWTAAGGAAGCAAGGAFVEWASAVPSVAAPALYLPDGLLATRLLLAPRFASESNKITLREDAGPFADTGATAAVSADGLSAPVPLATELPSNVPFGFDISARVNDRLAPVGSGVATYGSLFAAPAPVTLGPPLAPWAQDPIPSGRLLDLAETARKQLRVPTLQVTELGRFTPATIGGRRVAGEALLARDDSNRDWLVTGFAIDDTTLACVRVEPAPVSPKAVAASCRSGSVSALLGSATAPAATLWLGTARLANQPSATVADPAPGTAGRHLQSRSATGQPLATVPVS